MMRGRCFLFPLLVVLGRGCTFYTNAPPTADNGTGNMQMTGNNNPGLAELAGGSEPGGAWLNVTANLAGQTAACGTVSLVAASASEDLLVTAVAGRGLYSSTDGGMSWQKLGLGALSSKIDTVGTQVLFDTQDPHVFWETGINGQTGVVKTIDDGKHLYPRGTINGNEGLSIDFTDPDRKTMLVGGHERRQTVYSSSDSGSTWTDIGMQFPADADAPTYPLVLDPNTFLMGCPPKTSGAAGIYLSTDAGGTWTNVSKDGGGGPALQAADGTIYWMSPSGGVVKSTDGGQTFVSGVAANVLRSIPLIELPDGRLAGVSLGHVVVSADKGATWKFATATLPYVPSGFAYAVAQKAFFVWYSTCQGATTVPGNSIMRFDFK